MCAHFLPFMEWADVGGNRPAVWSYVPVQSSSCSLHVFLAVGKDTYQISLNKKVKNKSTYLAIPMVPTNHPPYHIRSYHGRSIFTVLELSIQVFP